MRSQAVFPSLASLFLWVCVCLSGSLSVSDSLVFGFLVSQSFSFLPSCHSLSPHSWGSPSAPLNPAYVQRGQETASTTFSGA